MGNILRIKNKNGDWVSVPSIKGDDGVGIEKIETVPNDAFNGGYTVEIYLSNGETTYLNIMNGIGIHHIETRRNDSDNGTLVEMFIGDGTITSVEIPDGKEGHTPVKNVDYFDGFSPYIRNGYWIDSNGETGVKAQGDDGYTPYIQGDYWYIDGNNTGVKAIGKDGDDGVGIEKIETEPHTAFNGGYYVNIHLSNGEITSFTIMNGNGIHHIESRRNDSDNGTLVDMFITDGTIASVEIPDGKNGYTPVKGTDYFTNADKQEMVNAVISALPKYEGSVS